MGTDLNITHLFVYGTLLTEGPTAHLLSAAPRRTATVQGQLFRLPAGYPAVLLRGIEPVYGELVKIPEYALEVLDIYKGVSEGLYLRTKVSIQSHNHKVKAWIYIMIDPEQHGGRRITSGRWRTFAKR